MRDIAETIKRDIAKALQPKPEKIDGIIGLFTK